MRDNVTRAGNQQERQGRLAESYIAGFVDGEGTFHVAFQRAPWTRFGWQIIPDSETERFPYFRGSRSRNGTRRTSRPEWLPKNRTSGIRYECSRFAPEIHAENDSARSRILRDYTIGPASSGEDIVRAAWRHAEISGNTDPPRAERGQKVTDLSDSICRRRGMVRGVVLSTRGPA